MRWNVNKMAEHDMGAARRMFGAGLFLQTIFQCHLAVEKALKGVCAERMGQTPPKTHNLEHLVALAGLSPPSATDTFHYFVKPNSAEGMLVKTRRVYPGGGAGDSSFRYATLPEITGMQTSGRAVFPLVWVCVFSGTVAPTGSVTPPGV